MTSIDMRLQAKAMALLGVQRGAIVAIDPGTGRILALASTPTFDPGRIVDPAGGPAYLQSLLAQTAAAPLLDRATQGRYVPGSIFKIVTASAALGSGAIGPWTTYPDQPAEERTGFLVDGFRVTDGPKPETGGPADFSQALAISSNIYFAHVGLATGAAALREWARRFGFEAQIPFDLPNLPSQVTAGGGPDAGFADQVEVANAAYGQAETLVTPLQMALVAATIANGGTLMAPELVTELRRADGTTEERPPKVWQAVLEPPIAGEIRDAMVAAVESPLGRPFAGTAAVPGVLTAGKSGTAQLGSGAPHSWFIGFAPTTSSRIAVAVLVEHGGAGAQDAVPIAGQLMAYALSLGP
jgi:peptidoglycan glycosyltransferase